MLSSSSYSRKLNIEIRCTKIKPGFTMQKQTRISLDLCFLMQPTNPALQEILTSLLPKKDIKRHRRHKKTVHCALLASSLRLLTNLCLQVLLESSVWHPAVFKGAAEQPNSAALCVFPLSLSLSCLARAHTTTLLSH